MSLRQTNALCSYRGGGFLPEMWLTLKRDMNGGKSDVEKCGFKPLTLRLYVAGSLNPSNT
jgi:hypothetical protein